MLRGVIVRGMGGLYTARTPAGEAYVLRCKKKFRRLGLSPLVGDEILFTPGEEEEHGWVEEILPRKTVCVRPPVANVELLLIVAAPVPAPDLLLVDRLLVRARQQGMDAALVVNKCDLDAALAGELSRQYARAEVPVLPVSARTGQGLDDLRQVMAGRLCCFAGLSGVGKSTLLNALTGLGVETGDISQKIQRGKNTTRHAELLEAKGLRVLDTAGVVWQMAELGKVDAGGGGTVAAYMAERDIDTLDAGVPVLSMHSPFETVGKLDCYMTFKGMKAVFEST